MPAVMEEAPTAQQSQHQRQLETIYRSHSALVLRTAYRVTGRMSDAEDVLQTVFMRLAARGSAAENLEAYLRRAAVNAALDVLRSRTTRGEIAIEDENGGGPVDFLASGDSGVHWAELRDALRQAIGKLSPKAAEMFVLRYIEGYENAEIARLMKTSAAVIAVSLFRIRKQLQQELGAYTRGRQ